MNEKILLAMSLSITDPDKLISFPPDFAFRKFGFDPKSG